MSKGARREETKKAFHLGRRLMANRGKVGGVNPTTPINGGSVYVCNLPFGTDETMLADYFATIGLLKKDKKTGRPKIWLYRDKETNEPKGDATVTYEDPHAAVAAVEWFNNKEFHGSVIGVFIAESKNKDELSYNVGLNLDIEDPGVGNNEIAILDTSGSCGDSAPPQGKAWQQDGDWSCTNPSCDNVNFAFRGVCNRCGSARPAGGSSAAGGGRGRGRGNNESSGGPGRAVGGPPNLFGPNDWSCPMCANINWAKRLKCNVCNTNKPGHNEGGVRGGRGGGYKELDEEEIEETRRRRREAEEDDGELYDEFGNLKKKFRTKKQQDEDRQTLPGAGRSGWEVEELGMNEREGREKSRDRGREKDENKYRDDRDRRGSRSQERERGRDRERDYYNNDRKRDFGREKERDRDRNTHRY